MDADGSRVSKNAAFVGGALAPRRPAPVLLLAGAQPREKMVEGG